MRGRISAVIGADCAFAAEHTAGERCSTFSANDDVEGRYILLPSCQEPETNAVIHSSRMHSCGVQPAAASN